MTEIFEGSTGIMTIYLRGAGAELEEARLASGRCAFALELLDFAALRLSLLLQPPDSDSILRRADVAVAHSRHDEYDCEWIV